MKKVSDLKSPPATTASANNWSFPKTPKKAAMPVEKHGREQVEVTGAMSYGRMTNNYKESGSDDYATFSGFGVLFKL